MTFQIKLGPAGSPGKSTLEGISMVKEMGLQTMEVQYSHGIGMGVPLAKKVGEEAKKHGIELSVHAPFFINLASKEKKKIEDSKKRILSSCKRMHYMGGGPVVFHPAYFGGMDKEKVFQMTKEAILEMMKTIKKEKWNCRLAPETTGKHSALGSLDETIRLVKETGCFMCIDFAHLYARNYGKIDYGEVLDKVKELKFKNLHCHFSGINYTMKGERNHLNISENKPPFEPLAKELIKKKINATIISESPITWKDSLEMKKIFEGLKYRF
ncbi:MAG: TIM barrel protein [Nanoarchaeota archaeon]|nr:TIM barrel protein [Nanoarchaeota archaeon]